MVLSCATMATETPRNPGGDSPAPPHTQTVNLEGGVASPPSDRPAAALIPPEPGDDAEVDFDDDDELSLGG